MIGLRIVLMVLLVAVMSWAWVRGERYIRRKPGQVPLFVALWRLLMLAATAVAIITAVALWTAQGAGQDADDANDRTRSMAVELCQQTREWQTQVLAGREADVRIAATEIKDAEAEREDAATAIAEAQKSGNYDNPFVAGFLERERIRARHRLESLTDELERRTLTLEELKATQLAECPPDPANPNTPTTGD